MTLCYVSAFLNIGRGDWGMYSRSNNSYVSNFLPYLTLFREMTPDELKSYKMVVFLDKSVDTTVFGDITSLPITIISIDEKWMYANTRMWNRLDEEDAIMRSSLYRQMFWFRLHFPENSNPKYTLINHCKIEFVYKAMELFSDADIFCWSDFGYFMKPEWIPSRPIDPNKLSDGTVHYTLINPLTDTDRDLIYTMIHADERFGGFFFGGTRDALRSFHTLYLSTHEAFQRMNLADDDQHIALRCYYEQPSLFTLHNLGGWHRALRFFQK